MQYFIEYVLGWENKVGKAATKGTIVHKVLEILAQAKLAEQNNEKYIDDVVVGKLSIDNFRTEDFIDYAHEKSFEYYKEKEQPTLEQKEFRETRRWVAKVIDEGFYDPRNLHIICPEKKFDLPIKQDWAKLPNGEYLRVRGTIDLTIKTGDYYEIVDWKTGARKSWVTGQYKSSADLDNDFQLRLYHYALRKLYPEIDKILVTIHYINSGGPYTVTHDDSNLEITESRMYEQLVRIKNCTHPTLKNDWFCSRVCHFGKTKIRNQTKCRFVTNAVRRSGLDTAAAAYTARGFKIDHYEEPG
jgi:hypothetical protein